MNNLVAALKALPLIRFALMLGGGLVATLAAGHVQVWLAYERAIPSDESLWLARIQGMMWLGLGSLTIVALVMITLAWGKVGKLTATIGGNTVDLDFDEEDKPDA